MAQQPGDFQSAREQRNLAHRARRLAQTQTVDADRMKLMQFAAELDKAAEALERHSGAISLPPTPAPPPQAHQPSADAEPAPPSV